MKSSIMDDNWSVDFGYDLDIEKRRNEGIIEKLVHKNRSDGELNTAFGLDTHDVFKSSQLQLEMAANKQTRIGYGQDPYGLAFLIARRENRKNTTFISTHAPYYEQQLSPVKSITVLTENSNGAMAKVITDKYTDFHAISHGTGEVELTGTDSDVLAKLTGQDLIRRNNQTG